jgi:outer membrane protein assembly factor BamB
MRPTFLYTGLFVCLVLLAPKVFAEDMHWPGYRGPNQNGMVPGAENGERSLPLSWSEKEHITWKTGVPGRGWSSPVIWGNQVWMTTADEEGHELSAVCLDFKTGKMLFNEVIFRIEKPYPLGNHVNSYASPSPVIEEGRVFVSFGSYGTACLSTSGFKVLWRREDLPCRHFRGPGSSPVLSGKLLILTMDGIDQQYTIALDKLDGKTVWRTDRDTDWGDLLPNGQPQGNGDFRKAYSTPIVFKYQNRDVFFSVGAKAAYLYNVSDGKEVWRVRHGEFSAAARPVADDHTVYFNTGYSKPWMIAVKLGGTGDVTDTHVLWRMNRSLPKRSSSLLRDGLLYQSSDHGIVSCVRASDGTTVWTGRLGAPVSASPVCFKNQLYFCDESGTTHVLKAGESFEILSQNTLDGGFMASPAVSGNALVLRSKTHVYKIEQPLRP